MESAQRHICLNFLPNCHPRATAWHFSCSDKVTLSPSNRSRCTDLIHFKQSFFRHYHSFSLVLKHRKSGQFRNVIRWYTRACSNEDRFSSLPVVGDFLFWLVIFFGLVLSLKLLIELSGIHWLRKVSYLKSRVQRNVISDGSENRRKLISCSADWWRRATATDILQCVNKRVF